MVATPHPPVFTVITGSPGQLLHMDTVGPSRLQSAGEKWYVLVIVGDYSRYPWVYFLASKDEAFSHFPELAKLFSVDLPGALRAIRGDNGTEFNMQFFLWLLLCWERDRTLAPYVPRQNGVVERKNGTLVEMGRTMLNEHNTPRRFWVEAVATACHVSNRALVSSSYELRFGRKPKVS